MKYRVIYTETAVTAIDDQATYLEEEGCPPGRMARWLSELLDTIAGLEEFPKRNTMAEFESSRLGFEVRRLVFGDHLVFYRVNEDDKVVEVLSFRHAARRSPQ